MHYFLLLLLFLLFSGCNSSTKDITETTPFTENNITTTTDANKTKIDDIQATTFECKLSFNDKLLAYQWHIENNLTLFEDINISPLWCEEFNYKTINVAVVDTGIDANHSDLKSRIDLNLSYRYSDASHDPSPSNEQLLSNSDANAHGTACAGIIAAESNNSIGVAGIAQNSALIGLNVFSNPTDDSFASATNYADVDVSSNSWGSGGAYYLYDDVVVLDSIKEGVVTGRSGKGINYIFASGNDVANANFQSILTSGLVVPVSAVDSDGILADYSDFGSCILIAAPGGARDGRYAPAIVTTDISGLLYGQDRNNQHYGVEGNEAGDYTNLMNGTSAAAPMVSGVVALMLGVNSELSYRDVQYILARTARQNDVNSSYWRKNGAGYFIHDSYGFGVVDSAKAVKMAKNFTPLPSKQEQSISLELNQTLQSQLGYSFEFDVNETFSIDYVQLTINTTHDNPGKLKMVLSSPSETNSTLAYGNTVLLDSMTPWTFASVHFLDEKSDGKWKFYLQDLGDGNSGELNSLTLTLRGY